MSRGTYISSTKKPRSFAVKAFVLCALSMVAAQSLAEPLPKDLSGSWRITRLLPTSNSACWSVGKAMPLIGSTLTYSEHKMTWKGGDIPLNGIATRMIDSNDLQAEAGSGTGVSFSQLEIRKSTVLEVNFQHEDADITGASTEVPGDSVLIAGPNRIVVSACGIYLEAMRLVAPKPKK
jgi:hypothetical protein